MAGNPPSNKGGGGGGGWKNAKKLQKGGPWGEGGVGTIFGWGGTPSTCHEMKRKMFHLTYIKDIFLYFALNIKVAFLPFFHLVMSEQITNKKVEPKPVSVTKPRKRKRRSASFYSGRKRLKLAPLVTTTKGK